IRADAENKRAKILSDAKMEAEKILSEGRESSARIVSQGRSLAEREVQEEKLRSIASARLEAKRRLLEARDEVLRRYEEQAMSYLDEFTKSKEYTDFLLKVTRDGVSKIGSDAIVHVNSRDKSLLGNGQDFEISSETLDCKGGALIKSKDGRRRVDNTIESIFKERKSDLRLKLTEEVFGKHG
ncbi:MAG: V-type ATP synthase subunit E, partial [Nitrososphaerales archaeon]